MNKSTQGRVGWSPELDLHDNRRAGGGQYGNQHIFHSSKGPWKMTMKPIVCSAVKNYERLCGLKDRKLETLHAGCDCVQSLAQCSVLQSIHTNLWNSFVYWSIGILVACLLSLVSQPALMDIPVVTILIQSDRTRIASMIIVKWEKAVSRHSTKFYWSVFYYQTIVRFSQVIWFCMPHRQRSIK